MVRWRQVIHYLSQPTQPNRRDPVLVEPTVDNSLAVGIDGAEDSWKDLVRKPVPHLELDPKASGAEVGQRHLSQDFG